MSEDLILENAHRYWGRGEQSAAAAFGEKIRRRLVVDFILSLGGPRTEEGRAIVAHMRACAPARAESDQELLPAEE